MIDARLPNPAGQAAAVIWTTDRALRFTSSQGAALKVSGHGGEQFVGMTLFEFFQTEDPGFPPIAAHLRALDGESATCEAEAWGHWWDCHVEPLHDDSGAIVGTVGVALDATNRRRADEQLRLSRQRYEDLVNSIDGIVWEADAETVHFTFVSQRAERLLGYPVERWLTEPMFWQDHMHPDDRAWAVPFCARATVERRPHEFEYRMIATDGREVWLRDIVTVVVENDRPAKLRGVMVGITEKKQAEEALREKEEQYRSIVEATSDGLVINDLEGRIVEVNPAFCTMHGCSRVELLRLGPTAFVHPDSYHLFEEYIETARSGGQFQSQALDVRRDGSPVHIEVHGTPFTYKGKPHALAVVRDVTDRVQAYQLLEQRVAERTRELSTLLEISRNVASTLELQSLLGLILDQLKFVTDYSGATVLTLEGDELSILAYRRPGGQMEGPPLRPRFSAQLLGEIWEVNRGGEPVIIADVRGDDGPARAYQAVWGEYLQTTLSYMRSALSVPMTLKDQVIGILGLSSGEPNFYTSRHAELAMAIANHAAVAIENARLYAEVQDKAAVEERQRLARELHDSVSQALYGIVLGTETARTLLNRDPSQAAAPLAYVHSLAETGLAEMHALIFELRPESLEREGLVAALSKQIAALRARYQIEVDTVLGDEPSIPVGLKEALYRIAQEALHNIVKHAEASHVVIRLGCDTAQIVLEVRDNGVGFDANGDFPGHLGLRSMRERAMRLGGSLEVDSAPGRGSTLRARVPYRVT